MRKSDDVITQVVNGKGPKLAEVLEISDSRCYEILSTDNPYPKTKRLIRAIAQVNPQGIALIKADMDALFQDLLFDNQKSPTSPAEIHRESSEAFTSVIEERPIAEQKKECRDAIAIWSRKLRELDAVGELPIRQEARKAVIERRNGEQK